MGKTEALKNNSIQRSSLILILKSFTKGEMRQFGKFVRSPIHNNRREVERFFNYIKTFYPSFADPDFTKEKIYSRLYPKNKYRDDVIRRLSSNLLKLCEDFISYRRFIEDKFDPEKNVLEHYLLKNLNSLYLKQLKKIENYMETKRERGSEYYLRLSEIENMKRTFTAKFDTTNKKTEMQIEIDGTWKALVISLLRLYCVATQNINDFNRKFNLMHFEVLLKIAETSGFMGSKVIEMYYFALKLRTTSCNDKTFYRLLNLIEKYSQQIEIDERFTIYNSLLGYCYNMKITPGKNFENTEFRVIQQMDEQKILLSGKVIYGEWFMYAFLTALRANKINYSEEFIARYKDFLPEKEKNNILNHALAELAIVKRDFKTALNLLSLPKYYSVNEKLRANNMYMKIYYEMGLSEQFFYQADSFKHILRNETSLNPENILQREKFVKLTSKLFKIKINEKDIPLKQIRKEIYNGRVFGVKWLLEKLDELEMRLKKK